jgi:hypothetical protein
MNLNHLNLRCIESGDWQEENEMIKKYFLELYRNRLKRLR